MPIIYRFILTMLMINSYFMSYASQPRTIVVEVATDHRYIFVLNCCARANAQIIPYTQKADKVRPYSEFEIVSDKSNQSEVVLEKDIECEVSLK